MNSSANSTTLRQGWTPGPDGRGTFDILWNCLFTSFLCTWVALHLNIPAAADSETTILTRKLRWMVQAVLGPEFVLAFATGQRAEAKRNLEAFHAAGHKEWTLRHAFYANMGGFVLHCRDSVPFPINGKQLLWLVAHEHLPLPELTELDVWDKSKADGFAKLATCVQTTWLVVHCICRALQRLPVTTLELTTVSFVICNLATYYEWQHKPLDVRSPTPLAPRASLADILISAGGIAREPYRQTPLDFIDDQSPSWLLDVQPHLRFKTWSRARPLNRFNNDRFPVVGASPHSLALFLINMLYASIHALGWDFDFPTALERLLWRVASVALIVTTFLLWTCEAYQDGVRLGRWRHWRVRLLRGADGLHPAPGVRRAQTAGRPFVPAWEVIFMTPITVVYTLARAYIVVECFFALRSLPVAAFEDVSWTKFFPHLA
ncbi:hypothetical protein QBC39DRAFT_253267 [Podospora conica]|nr:hypothetical protein QBC39DRAFT_253267 [Schizothecium conicum]